jgi:D-arabinose 1-dehydrogenase-like Zn-dependent alcohol dehydrogenase
MKEMTRAGFVKSSAAAVVGASALGAIATGTAEADEHAGSEPVVAYVRNPSKGEIAVMSGEREVVLRDRRLAARLARRVR